MFDDRDMQNHRLNQLVARIEKQGIVEGHYYKEGQMCVIGHMLDMAGLMDETYRQPDWVETDAPFRRVKVADSDREITSSMMFLHADTIRDYFGITTQILEELQAENDRHGEAETVIELINQIDVYGGPPL